MGRDLIWNSRRRGNYDRIDKFLKAGVARLLRDLLKNKCGGTHDQVQSRLLYYEARLTKCLLPHERDKLYPSSGVCGNLRDFDVALLIKILRCEFYKDFPLVKGWNELPPDDEVVPTADLARILFCRNTLSHLADCELSDDESARFWSLLAGATTRIADLISERDWPEVLKTFSSIGCRNIEMRITVLPLNGEQPEQHIPQKEEKSLNSNADHLKRARGHDSTWNEGLRGGNNCSELSVGCEAGACAGAERYWLPTDAPSNNPRGNKLSSKDIMKLIKDNYFNRCSSTSGQEGADFGSHLKEIGLIIVEERTGCLSITVRCLSLKSLQTLWDRNKSGRLTQAAEQFLVSDEILEELGLDRVPLHVEIAESEYKACRRQLILRDLQLYDMELIHWIEETIDAGSLDKAIAVINDRNPTISEETPSIIQKLIGDKQAINLANKVGQTALHIAAANGQSAVVRTLLAHGADANLTNKFGWTPLHVASFHGHTDIVRDLIDFQPNLNLECKDEFGRTALSLATHKNHTAVCILLECYGARPLFHVPRLRSLSQKRLTRVENGYNLVHRLCIEGQYRRIKHLLLTHSIGVDVIDGCRTSRDAPKFPGMSALEIVKASEGEEYQKIAKCFEEARRRYADIPKLHQAVEKCDIHETVALLLDKSAPVSAATANDETALHFATAIGSLMTMEVLVLFGADIDAQMSKGETPLMIASALQKTACVKSLLEKGANIAVQDAKRYTVLHHVARKGDTEILKQLLSGPQHPNLEICDPYGNTPLHLAVKYGRVEAAEFLISKGGDTNAHTKQCLRERMYMVQGTSTSGDIWMYVLIHKHLLALWEMTHKSNQGVQISDFGEILFPGKGKKPSKQIRKEIEELVWVLDNNDETPLILAVRSGNEDMARLLIKKGAKVGTPEAEGLTPLHMAAMKGSESMARLLVDHGADINASSSGGSPLTVAKANFNSEVASYLQSLTSIEGPIVPMFVSRLPELLTMVETVQRVAELPVLFSMAVTEGLLSKVLETKTQVNLSYSLNSPEALVPVPLVATA